MPHILMIVAHFSSKVNHVPPNLVSLWYPLNIPSIFSLTENFTPYLKYVEVHTEQAMNMKARHEFFSSPCFPQSPLCHTLPEWQEACIQCCAWQPLPSAMQTCWGTQRLSPSCPRPQPWADAQPRCIAKARSWEALLGSEFSWTCDVLNYIFWHEILIPVTWDFLSEIKCFSQCLLLSFYFKHVHNWPNQAMTILAIFSLFRAFLASRLSLVQLIITCTWSLSQLRLAWKSAVGGDWVLATDSSNLGGTRGNGVYQNLLPEW